ncbi:hypothetical protein B0H16DRAFT_369908 [Mycena metata]|uniref:Uncharacterized protein n=1 Tax=Mycena metata TaxID=1033252 RepID=A0AAD7NLW4_9AGAR|nr:hypothetical protein B0H16DRAFT_369908 [Mycena metata]
MVAKSLRPFILLALACIAFAAPLHGWRAVIVPDVDSDATAIEYSRAVIVPDADALLHGSRAVVVPDATAIEYGL